MLTIKTKLKNNNSQIFKIFQIIKRCRTSKGNSVVCSITEKKILHRIWTRTMEMVNQEAFDIEGVDNISKIK